MTDDGTLVWWGLVVLNGELLETGAEIADWRRRGGLDGVLVMGHDGRGRGLVRREW